MVKSLPQAPVEVVADQSQARISCGAFEGTVRLLPAEDFPAWQEPSGTAVRLEAGRFGEAVTQVGPAASRDEARPPLTGVLPAVTPGGVTMLATDSYPPPPPAPT